MKFLKRLFIYAILLVAAAGSFAYYQGMRADNYEAFLAEWKNKAEKIFSPDQEKEQEQPNTKHPNNPSTKMDKNETQSLQPLPTNPFAKIDRHARKATSSDEANVSSLAGYLQAPTSSEIEKARAIYIWLTDKIRYDDRAFNTGSYGDLSAKGVLASRRAVCEGFSNLFEALALEMGLEVRKVVGYSKGYGYKAGQRISKTDHAWNLAKINGQWRIFDATWGQGNGKSVGGKLVTEKKFDDYWFDVDPYEAVFNHLPENTAFALVQPSISLSTYQKMPYISSSYFKLGFDGQKTYKMAIANPKLKLPQTYSVDTHIKFKEAPGLKAIQQGKTYPFEIYVPRATQIALIDAKKNWTYLERDKGVFKLDYKAKNRGKLQLSIKHEGSGKSFSTAIAYEVN